MNQIVTAIYSRLRGDAQLSGSLATSVIDSGSAVYTTIPVPRDAVLPYVVITGPISDTPDDAFDAEYRRVLMDIHCYAARPDNGGGSVAVVNNIVERVRELFHRSVLTGDPRNLVCEASSVVINDDETAFGRVLTLRLLVT